MKFLKKLFGKDSKPEPAPAQPESKQTAPVTAAPPTKTSPKSAFKSHPLYGRSLTDPEIAGIVKSRDFTRIMEVLVFADRKSSLRMSIAAGFYHRYGCLDGLMIHDRDGLENREALELLEAEMHFSRELFGKFRCNRCRATDRLTVSWLKDGYEKGYFPLSPPPADPLAGIVRARQLLAQLESKEKPVSPDTSSNTMELLMSACSNGDLAKVLMLFSCMKIDVNLRQQMQERNVAPLHAAVLGGNTEILRLLLGKGSDPNIPADDGMRPLHLAVLVGHAEMVKDLLANKADVNGNDLRDSTPLHVAALKGRLEIARLLVGAGANINARTNYGATPRNSAAKENQSALVEYLSSIGGQ